MFTRASATRIKTHARVCGLPMRKHVNSKSNNAFCYTGSSATASEPDAKRRRHYFIQSDSENYISSNHMLYNLWYKLFLIEYVKPKKFHCLNNRFKQSGFLWYI